MEAVDTNVTVVLISQVKSLPNKGSREMPFCKLIAHDLEHDLVSSGFIFFHRIKKFLVRSF